FGKVSAGAGTEQRYQASVSLNKFNNEQQISLLGNLNNTNASTFSFGGIGGSMGNMMMSMAKSMGIGQGGGGIGATLGNFGINDGIGTTKSIGLNYADKWSSKINVNGSYTYSEKAISTIKAIGKQNFSADFPNTNNQQSTDYTVTDNHRFNFNLEYNIDSFNYLKFTPNISYKKTNSDFYEAHVILDKDERKISDGTIDEFAISKLPNLNGNLLLNHRFHKKGRNLSVNLNGSKSSTRGTDDISNQNYIYGQLPGPGPFPGGSSFSGFNRQYIPQDNDNSSFGIRVSYNEPLSKKRSLEFNYAYNYQFTGNDRQTYNVDSASSDKNYVDSLSSIYSNVYIINRVGVNFKTNAKKYNYTVGLAVQAGSIESDNAINNKDNYTQHLVNFYPVIRFAYNFSRSRSFNLNYNGSSSQPGYSQLNPATDNSNSLYITKGNPDLKPEFTNTLSTRYNNFDFISGNVFFGSISGSFTTDKIVTNTRQLGFGRQEITYLNTDGFFTVTAFYNISRPRQNRKYVFNWGGNIIYNNNISFINSERNIAYNWVFGQRISEDFKIKKWLETNATVNYSLNSTKNSLTLSGISNTTTNTWNLANTTRVFITEDFIISYDIDKTFNSGYSGNVNANPLVVNSTIEKQFLKKKNLSVKLQAFDIFNENKGISRSVTGSEITDTRTNRLSRYFLLSFVLRLNKFAGDQQGQMKMMGPGGPGGPPPGMRPF
ncbi:MAG: outer membrane beta-barrel protein, partial [Ferruginibacter sp.]